MAIDFEVALARAYNDGYISRQEAEAARAASKEVEQHTARAIANAVIRGGGPHVFNAAPVYGKSVLAGLLSGRRRSSPSTRTGQGLSGSRAVNRGTLRSRSPTMPRKTRKPSKPWICLRSSRRLAVCRLLFQPRCPLDVAAESTAASSTQKGSRPMAKRITVVKDPEIRDAEQTDEIIATAIIELAAGMKRLDKGPLKRETVVTLLHDHTKLSKTQIRIVLNALEALGEIFLKPKDKAK